MMAVRGGQADTVSLLLAEGRERQPSDRNRRNSRWRGRSAADSTPSRRNCATAARRPERYVVAALAGAIRRHGDQTGQGSKFSGGARTSIALRPRPGLDPRPSVGVDRGRFAGGRYQIGERADQATRAVEVLVPIVLGERHDLDLSASPRRMDKTTLAEVNADVGKLQSAGIEKNQIARQQIGHGIFSPMRESSCEVRGSITPVTCWNT